MFFSSFAIFSFFLMLILYLFQFKYKMIKNV